MMTTFKYNAMAMVIGTLLFVPLSPSSARADDDDDWEDRWEEYEDEWDDDDDDGFFRRRGWHRYYEPRGYRFYDEPGVRYYQYYDGPAYRYYYPERRRVYRYYEPYPPVYRHYGEVHAGPAHVYYGRRGSVRVGPLYVEW